MKNIYINILIGILLLTTGCDMRLDSFLFNPQTVTQYYLDAYEGESELDLPAEYVVSTADIHQFQYQITDQGENLNIHAIYIGDLSTIATDTVILYCHGNKHHMDNYWQRQKLLSYVGGYKRFGVLMFDYPGFGMSEGKPTEENVYISADGALKWLKNQGLTDDRLVVYGYSLGSAPASRSVGKKEFAMVPHKIILEAPFASSEVMVQDGALLNMPASYFVNTKINNAEQMKQCTVPLYWIHGAADDFLEVGKHGQIVYDNHSQSWKRKSIVDGAVHNDVPAIMGYNTYKENLLEFILE